MNASHSHDSFSNDTRHKTTRSHDFAPSAGTLSAAEWEQFDADGFLDQLTNPSNDLIEQLAQERSRNPLARESWAYVIDHFNVWYKRRRTATRKKIIATLHELEAAVQAPGLIDSLAIDTLITRWTINGNKSATINSKLSTLRTVTGKIFDLFDLPRKANPFQLNNWNVESDDDDTEQTHHLSADEIRRVLRQADEDAQLSELERGRYADGRRWRAYRRRALVYVLEFTGLRANEALNLQSSEIDTHAGMIRITGRVKRTKTRASKGIVPLTELACKAIDEWLLVRGESKFLFRQREQDKPWISGGPGYKPLDELHALEERAGVTGLTMLAFRHSWATHAETLWGLTDEQIKRVLRHTTVKTQQHYRHPDVANLRAIAGRIDFGS